MTGTSGQHAKPVALARVGGFFIAQRNDPGGAWHRLAQLPGTEDEQQQTNAPDGARQVFAMADFGGFLASAEPVPEPHEFTAVVRVGGQEFSFRSRRATNTVRRGTTRRTGTTTCGPPSST